MSDKENKKVTYAMPEDSAISQIIEANKLFNRAKSMLETYLCGDVKLKYKDRAVEVLAEYMTNNKFYANTLENYVLTGERIKSEKNDEQNIVIPIEDFGILSTYLVVVAACENDLECLGISMREH